jgi:hypothetical protein
LVFYIFSKCCLFSFFSFKIDILYNKGFRRSHRMQGFPPEGYKPLPPNSPKDTYREEVENHSYVGSDANPLL